MVGRVQAQGGAIGFDCPMRGLSHAAIGLQPQCGRQPTRLNAPLNPSGQGLGISTARSTAEQQLSRSVPDATSDRLQHHAVLAGLRQTPSQPSGRSPNQQSRKQSDQSPPNCPGPSCRLAKSCRVCGGCGHLWRSFAQGKLSSKLPCQRTGWLASSGLSVPLDAEFGALGFVASVGDR